MIGNHHSNLTSLIVLWSSVLIQTFAQSPLPIYTDRLVNGFQDWSWAGRDFASTNVVYSGTKAIRVSAGGYQALALHSSVPIPSMLYTNLTFWIRNSGTGNQTVQIRATLNQAEQAAVSITAGGTWQQRTISLVALGVAGKTNFDGIWFQNPTSGSIAPFYVDEIQLKPASVSFPVHVSVDASKVVRASDERWFGLNTAVWDGNFSNAETVSLLRELGTRIMRFPGGSLSDDYHWNSNTTGTNTWKWTTSFSKFATVATNIGSQVIITVNYGSGTAAEAAAWVRHANVTNHFRFKYWEIGNENYGTWETDTNVSAHDPYTYATRARDYIQQMKAADPDIKIGVVVVPGEDSSANGYSSHPATNIFTGKIHNGWTPVLLSTLRQLGVAPDFLVHHRYPEWTAAQASSVSDSDTLLLQSSSAWLADAADLRGQLQGYFGPGGTNIELLCTENNSDAGAQGRQSTSLANALYYADSLGQLMQTEFNSLIWWDLRNGSDTSGSFDSSLYGWRNYGDLGMINGVSNRHPAFYAAKLMRRFVEPGDSIVKINSDALLVGAYAARSGNGALKLLFLNKDSANSLSVEVNLTGFSSEPGSVRALVYGIPQDEAARTNAPLSSQDIAELPLAVAGTNFSYNLPPFSINLVTLTPAGPALSIFTLPANDTFVIEVLAQSDGAFVLQSSPNLADWTALATNQILIGTAVYFTNVVSVASPHFFRAAWQR
jgi:alpha-N-arabinofuranosidase